MRIKIPRFGNIPFRVIHNDLLVRIQSAWDNRSLHTARFAYCGIHSRYVDPDQIRHPNTCVRIVDVFEAVVQLWEAVITSGQSLQSSFSSI